MGDSSKTQHVVTKIIEKKALNDLLALLMEDYQIIGPTERDGLILFRELESPDELSMDFLNSRNAPKSFFFPQSERILAFEGPLDQRKVVSKEERPVRRILWGVRPCDVQSVLILDKLFINEDYVDDYYKEKRDNTIVVGYGCNQPRSTCFCISLHNGPFSREGSDIFIRDIGEAYLLEAMTPQGEELVSNLPDATLDDIARGAAIEKEAMDSLPGELDVQGIADKLKGLFDDPLWEPLSEQCLGCGICTYLCPTCHCFDIQDEAMDDRGERVRNWDSCMFPLFTLHGSGHQPRNRPFQRMRQRLMHKFSYYVENFGKIACVGCGRCITNCPVNIDIRENIREIMAK